MNALEPHPLMEADMVYARFLFMHLSNPRGALSKTSLLLKIGGVLCIEESILGSVTIFPFNENVAHYVKTLVALGKERGG